VSNENGTVGCEAKDLQTLTFTSS